MPLQMQKLEHMLFDFESVPCITGTLSVRMDFP